MRLVLASNSAARKRILSDAGFRFLVAPSKIEEISDATDHPALVQEIAAKKARAVAALPRYRNDLVLGADTIVVLHGERLGKPANEEDARRMLQDLSGAGHYVITGLALAHREMTHTAAARANVTFRDLEESDIEKYLKTGEWKGKAGAYAGQGRGAVLVDHIDGDHLAMAGLPLRAFYDLLAEKNIDPYQFMR